MKLSPNLTGRGAVVGRSLVAEEAVAVVVAEDEMTIVATRVSRASLAGNNSGDEILRTRLRYLIEIRNWGYVYA
jgi:hypothetical protein